MTALVDTSVWVDFLKGQDCLETHWLRTAIAEGLPVVVPGLVVTEVLRGLSSERDAGTLERLLEEFPAAPALGDEDYRGAARLYRDCRSKGVTIASTVDCLIAQLAIRHRFLLLTRDRGFEAVARVAPLRLLRPRAH